jgi:hypothetical protein
MSELSDPLSIQSVVDRAVEDIRQDSKSRSKSGEKTNVRDPNEEWTQLCQQAAVEKDPERLMRLVGRISNCWTRGDAPLAVAATAIHRWKSNTESSNA